MHDDFDLLQAWSAGNAEAGETLVRRYYKRIYGFVRSKVEDAPRDLVQRTFLICLERHDRFRRDAKLAAFLLGIARNVIFDHFRSVDRGRQFDPLHTTVHDLAPSPSLIAMGREEQRLLLMALRTIPLDFQITLELFYWEGLSVDEIAEVLEVAPGTIKSRMHRARQLLRETMERLPIQDALLRATLDGFDHWARGLQVALSAGHDDDT